MQQRSAKTVNKNVLINPALYILLTCIFVGCYDKVLETEEGLASYYADFFHGRKTASGALYDTAAMTCAHPHWPLGSVVRVTNLQNNHTIEVVVNDRGPHVDQRIIDLSKAAAKELDFIKKGLVKVHLELLDRREL